MTCQPVRRGLRAALACGLAAGATLLAQPAPPGRTVSWDRARGEVAKYRATQDLSGLVDVDAHIDPRVDAEDLPALCEARKTAVAAARAAADRALRALPPGRDPITDERRAAFHRQLGAIASFEGDTVAALQHFEAGREALAPYAEEYRDLRAKKQALDQAAAVALLRRGEVENCLVGPGADRCIFPLRRGGIHQHGTAARDAFDRLTALSQADPANLEVRWLVNLSAMLQGRYPGAVPAPARMAESIFSSPAGSVPRLTDMAPEAGIRATGTAGGTIVDDFDNDGLLDIVFSSVDFCAPVRFYRNRGDGTFEDRTEAAKLTGQLGGLNATHTDFDNDGRLDLFIHRGGWEIPMRNSLLRNNPDGTFTDVTRAAGLSSGQHSTHSVAWFDFDNDGWVDVFVGHELTPSQLFRNRGDGTFADVSARAGVGATAFTKGVTAGDYDNDGDADLYLSNMFGDNVLYRNNGDGTFTDVAALLAVQRPFASFPTWFFDYDNDGWLDIFVASYPNSVEEFVKHYLNRRPHAETLTLYRNKGDGTFEDVSEKTGLARVVPTMGSNFGDLDNDGFLDMYLGTGAPSLASLMPNVMLRNDAGRRFVDVTAATGLGHLQKGHGVAFADLDDDGDQDVALNAGGAVPGDFAEDAFFVNPGQAGQHWVAVRLIGAASNRAAIGARIRVTVRDGRGTARRSREVTAGGSFGSNSFTQHIGLGRARVVDVLEVFWPASKTTQVFRQVPVDRVLTIREHSDTYDVRVPEDGRRR